MENKRAKQLHICPHANCSKIFTKNSKLVYHIRRHTGERPFACDVLNCNKAYLYSFHLRRHKESHTQRERIKCPIPGCHLELTHKSNLKRHIKRKHNDGDYYPFRCDFCKQGFHKKKQLLNHIHLHTGVPSFQCVICNTFCFTTRELNRHKRTHQQYKCRCGAIFERWTALTAHRRTCDDAKKVCRICNAKFEHTNNFKAHLETHFMNNVHKFTCGYVDCNRSYMYKRNLAHHIRRFHLKQKSVKKIPCTMPGCSMSFSRNQILKNHLQKRHSETVPIKKERRPRKDKGISRKSVAAMLAGLELPKSIHMHIIGGGKIEKLPNVNVNNEVGSKCSSSQVNKSDSEQEFVSVVC